VGLRYQIQHPPKEASRYRHSTTLGFDWKESNSDLYFGGRNVNNTSLQIFQMLFQHTLTRLDAWGATQLTLGLTVSPGTINSANSDSNFTIARAGSDPTYAYFTGTLERTTRLGHGFAWVTEATGQYASEPLVSSEQFGMGGKNSVRGYEEYEVNADKGLYINNTLRKDKLHLRSFNESELNASPFIFWDYAFGERLPTPASTRRGMTLHSIGAGVDLSFGESLSAYGIFGAQLQDSGFSDGRRNNKAHFGLRYEY